jgi:hypothetical protein
VGLFVRSLYQGLMNDAAVSEDPSHVWRSP